MMDGNHAPKKIYNYKPEGRRHVGRPRSRWKDQDYPSEKQNGPVGSYLDVDDNDNDDKDNE
jgi:hypothetical protein